MNKKLKLHAIYIFSNINYFLFYFNSEYIYMLSINILLLHHTLTLINLNFDYEAILVYKNERYMNYHKFKIW